MDADDADDDADDADDDADDADVDYVDDALKFVFDERLNKTNSFSERGIDDQGACHKPIRVSVLARDFLSGFAVVWLDRHLCEKRFDGPMDFVGNNY